MYSLRLFSFPSTNGRPDILKWSQLSPLFPFFFFFFFLLGKRHTHNTSRAYKFVFLALSFSLHNAEMLKAEGEKRTERDRWNETNSRGWPHMLDSACVSLTREGESIEFPFPFRANHLVPFLRFDFVKSMEIDVNCVVNEPNRRCPWEGR